MAFHDEPRMSCQLRKPTRNNHFHKNHNLAIRNSSAASLVPDGDEAMNFLHREGVVAIREAPTEAEDHLCGRAWLLACSISPASSTVSFVSCLKHLLAVFSSICSTVFCTVPSFTRPR